MYLVLYNQIKFQPSLSRSDWLSARAATAENNNECSNSAAEHQTCLLVCRFYESRKKIGSIIKLSHKFLHEEYSDREGEAY